MKFNVRDENGKEYCVEEVEKSTETTDETTPLTNTEDEDKALLPDEISALKRLAAVADKLIALTNTTDEDVDSDVDETDIDDEEEEVKEEVIDTASLGSNKANDSKKTAKDSIKKSACAIEKSNASVNDSVDTDEIADAWAKRYGGNK